jgi:hypothetical protein
VEGVHALRARDRHQHLGMRCRVQSELVERMTDVLGVIKVKRVRSVLPEVSRTDCAGSSAWTRGRMIEPMRTTTSMAAQRAGSF